MERYSEVVGLPVICAVDGKKAGVVKDVVFCPKERRVVAFLLDRKSWEVRKKLILAEDVLSLGTDALIINDLEAVKEPGSLKGHPDFKSKGDLLGLKIYSKKGEDLGIVKDVLFDFEKGTVDGVEVSDGLLHDIVEGRNVLPLFGKVEFGEENILVDSEAVEEMFESGRGLKKMIEWDK